MRWLPAMLTDDPFEWDYRSPIESGSPKGIWVNRHNSNAVSEDGGVTFRMLDKSEKTPRKSWKLRRNWEKKDG